MGQAVTDLSRLWDVIQFHHVGTHLEVESVPQKTDQGNPSSVFNLSRMRICYFLFCCDFHRVTDLGVSPLARGSTCDGKGLETDEGDFVAFLECLIFRPIRI